MIVVNSKTGATREVRPPSNKVLERVLMDGIDKCVGPCKCTVEPDGHCPQGWPSRSMANGVI